MKERPKCIIKDLNVANSIGIIISLLIYYAIFVVIFASALYFGFQTCFMLKDNITLLFMAHPIFNICIHITCYILYVIVALLVSLSALFSALKRTVQMMTNELYKLVFIDSDNNVLYTKYDSLDYLRKLGYKILSSDEIENNKEE